LKLVPGHLPSAVSDLKQKRILCVLTIAGSDSGGGAGIQADLKTFASLGVHGASVVTCITAQNPKSVRGIEGCSPAMVRKQLEAVFEGLRPAAVKTGMLYSAGIVRSVVDFFREHGRGVPLVIDPVMVSTSGVELLKANALRLAREELFPLGKLLTPNLEEAGILIGAEVRSPEDMRAAARELHRRFGCAALVKGGHLRGGKEAVDIFYDGKEELLLCAPFIRGMRTHGTGCTYSAAIAAYLARGFSLSVSVQRAKEYITRAIAGSGRVARYSVLDSWNVAR
jgi:hydroxymethylpyrimidine/phosphomethylpyrimidine kinase